MVRRAVETAAYSRTQGLQLMQGLLTAGKHVFTTDDAARVAAELGIAASYVPRLLSALVASGWLLRVRRGLYACSGEIADAPRVHPFAIATALVAPSAISHWSALSHHGLTEQVPHGVYATTPRRVVTPGMRGGRGAAPGKHAWEVAGTRYEYMCVKPERFFGHELVWVDERSRVPIADRERTILDCFAAPDTIGGLGEAVGVVAECWPELDLERLARYALRYGQDATIKRLGWALEHVGASGPQLRLLLDHPVAGYRVLDPAGPRRGPCDRRWMIQYNLGGGGVE